LSEVTRKLEATGRRVVPVALDLCSQASIEQAMAEVVKALGRVDVLVNNAGVNLRQTALDVTPEQWHAVMQANATGTFFITQQMGRHLIGGGQPGCIISIASTHGVLGAPERSTYGTPHFESGGPADDRMLAIEWAPHGIRVNAIAPGRVDTPSPSRAATSANPNT